MSEEFELVPAEAGGWPTIATALARKALAELTDDQWHYLVVETTTEGRPFVQLAVRHGCVLAEVRADRFALEGPLLDPSVAQLMLATGWNPPDPYRFADDDRVNWWQEWPSADLLPAICRTLLEIFAAGFSVDANALLFVVSYAEDGS